MPVEEKWKANQAKVAFMKQFPGLTLVWERLHGKTIETVAALPSKPGAAVLVFSDGSFTVAPPLAPEPWELTEGLIVARGVLESKHRQAYAEYDRLVRTDKEALRAARLEKILGAIQNNLEQIPELKDRLRELVKNWK
jgi:diglucosylglycerate octanoyltransferase